MGDRYKLGNVVRLSTTIRDAAGALADPADVSVTVRSMTGTALFTHDYSPGPVVRDGIGAFHDDVSTGPAGQLTSTGTYFYEWISTGTTGAASGWFDVLAATPDLLTLTDAKSALGKTRTTDDAELRLFVDAVNRWLDEEVGPVVPRVVTERVDACRGALILSAPVLSITSATQNGASVSVSGWDPGEHGIVTGPVPLWGTYSVTYLAGYSPIPADLVLALRELVQHWWETQRAASPAPRAAGTMDDSGFDPRLGFAVPNRVAEKLEHYRPPAIA